MYNADVQNDIKFDIKTIKETKQQIKTKAIEIQAPTKDRE